MHSSVKYVKFPIYKVTNEIKQSTVDLASGEAHWRTAPLSLCPPQSLTGGFVGHRAVYFVDCSSE